MRLCKPYESCTTENSAQEIRKSEDVHDREGVNGCGLCRGGDLQVKSEMRRYEAGSSIVREASYGI